MKHFSDGRWNALTNFLDSSHGELVRRKCQTYKSLVEALFCGTLDRRHRFAFDYLHGSEADLRTQNPMSLIQVELE